MLDNLDERLMQIRERVRAKRKLESMLRQAQQILGDEQSKCSALKDQLAQEKADVSKLEGLSLTGMFYSVLGTKDDRLEKERQEFLAAKLKHDECLESLEDARQEVQRVQNELATFSHVDVEYQHVINEKEKRLAGASGDAAETLIALSEKLADLKSDSNELEEAIRAGEAALHALQQVSSELGSAANWGTWDLLGGGLISTMAKHSKIDSAKEHAHHAQRQLRRFQEELADADQRLNVSLEIDGFSKFADYFFDGLISDWVVQSKIQQASSAATSTISQVTSAVDECRRKLAETQEGVETVSKARQAFIEQA